MCECFDTYTCVSFLYLFFLPKSCTKLRFLTAFFTSSLSDASWFDNCINLLCGQVSHFAVFFRLLFHPASQVQIILSSLCSSRSIRQDFLHIWGLHNRLNFNCVYLFIFTLLDNRRERFWTDCSKVFLRFTFDNALKCFTDLFPPFSSSFFSRWT
jgi:hypothetical protein